MIETETRLSLTLRLYASLSDCRLQLQVMSQLQPENETRSKAQRVFAVGGSSCSWWSKEVLEPWDFCCRWGSNSILEGEWAELFDACCSGEKVFDADCIVCSGGNMFSTTGIIVNGKRSTLAPHRLNCLTFIHDNYQLYFDMGSSDWFLHCSLNDGVHCSVAFTFVCFVWVWLWRWTLWILSWELVTTCYENYDVTLCSSKAVVRASCRLVIGQVQHFYCW